jgi:hypothetical protein
MDDNCSDNSIVESTLSIILFYYFINDKILIFYDKLCFSLFV